MQNRIYFKSSLVIILVFTVISLRSKPLIAAVIGDFYVEQDTDLTKKFILERGQSPAGDNIFSEIIQLISSAKYEEAIKKINDILIKDPGLPAAREILGTALILKGDIDEGLISLNKAVELNPKQSSAYIKIGNVYMIKKEYQKAKQNFLNALKINNNNIKAHQWLGIIYEKDGEFKKAEEHYEKGLIGENPDYIGIKVNLSRLYNLSSRFSESVKLLEGLIKKDNKEVTAHVVLGRAYLGLKELDKAIGEFKIVRVLEPDTERAAWFLGIAYRQNENLNESVEELEKVIKSKPEQFAGYYQMGETLFKMKKYDQAIESYNKAKELNPKPFFIKKRIAEVYLLQKKHSDAISICEEMIESPEADIDIYSLLAGSYQLNNQLESAEKTLQLMVTKFPGNPFSFYKLGFFYEELLF